MSFEPSIVRRSLDYLLDAYPSFDLVSINWHVGVDAEAELERTGLYDPHVSTAPAIHTGPWVIVRLGQPSEVFGEVPAWALWQFAIWKRTGALHTMRDGAVSDDPIWTPQ